jgi:hypothetical protein
MASEMVQWTYLRLRCESIAFQFTSDSHLRSSPLDFQTMNTDTHIYNCVSYVLESESYFIEYSFKS